MTIKKIITIGRGGDSDCRINSESVSNSHAMVIESDKGKYLLIDCNSTNGTRLPSRSGSERISQTEVRLNDLVFFGDKEFKMHDIVNSADTAASGKDLTRFRDPFDGSIKSKPR